MELVMFVGDVVAALLLFLLFYKLDFWAAKWVVARVKKVVGDIKKTKEE